MTNQMITRTDFEKEIGKLLLRDLPDLPKSARSQAILLKAIMLHLGPAGAMTEQEVNRYLGEWAAGTGSERLPDHATLRRGLVDAGFLSRSRDGASYAVNPGGPRAWQFEPAVDEVDVPDLLAAAREEVARRRAAHLSR